MSVPGLLDGIHVLDLSRVMTGPYCTMMLADLGADVIKIERPGAGDDTRSWGPPFLGGESAYFLSVNRNKRSVTVDLTQEEGRQIIRTLAARSDALVENFSPGTATRLGIDYDSLARENPRLVYCSISGYGQEGPYRAWPAYDLILQGMGGLQAVTGEPGRPPLRIGVAVADLAGGMFAAFAIVAALLRRVTSGSGEFIDLSLLDSQVAWLTYMAGIYLATGREPVRSGSKHPTIVPYQTFATADGYVNVAAGNDRLFRRLCEAIGTAALADDPRFSTNRGRVENRGELEPGLEAVFATASTGDWLRRLREHGVPCGPVLSIRDIVEDPQVAARGLLVELDHPAAGRIRQVGPPYRMRTSRASHDPPPLLGQHTEEILRSLGYDPDRIGALRRDHVV